MKNISTIIFIGLFLFSCLQSFSQVTDIPFNGSTIIVNGEFDYLEIRGQEKGKISIQEYERSNQLDQYYTKEINGDVCTITIKHINGGINLFVPSTSNLKIKPIARIYEDRVNDFNNYGNINLRDLNGSLEINADGYHVQFKDISGMSSIVTYGDIYGKYKNTSLGKMMNLDTYLGNVKVEIAKAQRLKIEANALKGEVSINPIFALSENPNKLLSIHLENGQYAVVDTLAEIDLTYISHKAMSDQMIELFIKYWGPGLYPEARSKLEKLGYHKMLNEFSSAESKKFNKYDLAIQLMDLIEENGVPNYKMVGPEMPFKSIAFLLPFCTDEFITKYSAALSFEMGRQVIKRSLNWKKRRSGVSRS